MSQSVDQGRAMGVIALTFGINLTVGLVGYFVAFVFAYGFRDEIGATEHIAFLVQIAVLVLLTASLCAPTLKSAFKLRWPHAAGLSLSLSLAFNLLAIGVGSIISAANKDQGSVSADLSTSTDVAVAACLLGASAIAAGFAWRALPRKSSHP